MVGVYVILALLALAGGAFSFYFLQVYRGNWSAEAWWVPPVCRVSRNTCQSIVDTPYGRTLGKSNAFWGTILYPLLFAGVAASGIFNLEPTFLAVVSAGMVGISLYLSWGLYRLNTLCRVCVAVHVVNVVFFAAALVLLIRSQ